MTWRLALLLLSGARATDFCPCEAAQPCAAKCDACRALAREHELQASLGDDAEYGRMRARVGARLRAGFASAAGLLVSMAEAHEHEPVPSASRPRAASVLRADLPV